MPKKDSSLGRSLIKAHKRQQKRFVTNEGFRHTSELPDGRDFGRLNLASVTQQTSLNEFLEIADLAERDYTAEMRNIKIIDPNAPVEEAPVIDYDESILCIPRRPHWDLVSMSKDEILQNENKAFLEWRRKLAFHEEEEGVPLTPFEKNIEIWKQLWRVIERSDVVVQILDARNPLLFRCEDLEKYVKETGEWKINMLLLNKADLLTESERQCWSNYFQEKGIQVIFFSALLEGMRQPEDDSTSETIFASNNEACNNSPDLFSRKDLLKFFRTISSKFLRDNHTPTVGLVGYPNVGKSTTLNALLTVKRVQASATPGKTKNFQTFLLEDKQLCLCDSPGLVFPNFASTKAEMLINGILPIDHMTECKAPTSLVVKYIPRHVLEAQYSIFIKTEGRDTPTAEEFLNAHGYNRGFMTARGLPDNSRSARHILKDFSEGKLLYCHAPPGVNQEEYHKFPETKAKKSKEVVEGGGQDKVHPILSAADKKFFASQVHFKGRTLDFDPDKKHRNNKKKEKLRRVYKGNPYE